MNDIAKSVTRPLIQEVLIVPPREDFVYVSLFPDPGKRYQFRYPFLQLCTSIGRYERFCDQEKADAKVASYAL